MDTQPATIRVTVEIMPFDDVTGEHHLYRMKTAGTHHVCPVNVYMHPGMTREEAQRISAGHARKTFARATGLPPESFIFPF